MPMANVGMISRLNAVAWSLYTSTMASGTWSANQAFDSSYPANNGCQYGSAVFP